MWIGWVCVCISKCVYDEARESQGGLPRGRWHLSSVLDTWVGLRRRKRQNKTKQNTPLRASSPLTLFFFKNFFILYWDIIVTINNVIVSGEQQRDSAIHMHVSTLPQTPLPSRLPHDIGQSSLCYTVGPCWLSILNMAVCTYQFQAP